MKVLQSSVIRAIVAIVVGVLLVKYREETMTWMTITVGLLFFLSGAVSCIAYYMERERTARLNAQPDKNSNEVALKAPMFPIVGLGSLILGIILAMMPGTFITWVVYILAAILILGSINQFMNLAAARRFAHVPVAYWLFPVVTLIVGIIVVSKPMETATLPLKIIGWCLMFYGVVELLNALKINQMKRTFDKNEENKIVTGIEIKE
ncbi:HdeD family acid-resistance protein [Prevotella dentasini]|uniref:HdeD family acid-resistance protein n=1 Tax=Prevotella dentasini TaxID=589537 RepID=UPI00046A4AA0|nr:DUF308 domain-containing protein [Prevotella dentasini]